MKNQMSTEQEVYTKDELHTIRPVTYPDVGSLHERISIVAGPDPPVHRYAKYAGHVQD